MKRKLALLMACVLVFGTGFSTYATETGTSVPAAQEEQTPAENGNQDGGQTVTDPSDSGNQTGGGQTEGNGLPEETGNADRGANGSADGDGGSNGNRGAR